MTLCNPDFIVTSPVIGCLVTPCALVLIVILLFIGFFWIFLQHVLYFNAVIYFIIFSSIIIIVLIHSYEVAHYNLILH